MTQFEIKKRIVNRLLPLMEEGVYYLVESKNKQRYISKDVFERHLETMGKTNLDYVCFMANEIWKQVRKNHK